MSDLLKQGESLLSAASGSSGNSNNNSSSSSGGAAGLASTVSGLVSGGSGNVKQNIEGQVAANYAEQGVNAIEDKIGFDKDHKYDQYEQKGIQAIEQKFLKK